MRTTASDSEAGPYDGVRFRNRGSRQNVWLAGAAASTMSDAGSGFSFAYTLGVIGRNYPDMS